MLGIPEWAVGIAFIMIVVSLAHGVRRQLSPGDRARGWKRSKRDLAPTLEDMQARLTELEDVERRLGDVEEMQRRLSELEERVDFAERLLAKQRDAERLAPPKS